MIKLLSWVENWGIISKNSDINKASRVYKGRFKILMSHDQVIGNMKLKS
jgi:hypothetical protein